jgi:hypothetical protein
MEERGKLDPKRVTNKPPSHVNVPSITLKLVNNPWPTKVEPIQQIRITPIYVSPKTSATYMSST